MKGRIKYVPPDVLAELDRIKSVSGLSDANCFRKVINYAKIGMEAEAIRDNFLFIKRKK